MLHLLGFGWLLDAPLLEFFAFKLYGADLALPLWAFLSYLILAILSIFSKRLALFCVGLNFVPFILLLWL